MYRTLSLVLVGVMLCSCSFITVRGAPAKDPGVRPVACTTSRGAPVLDIIPTAALLLVAVLAFSDAGSGGDEAGLVGVIGGGALLGAAPFAISAGYGFSKTSGCRRINRTPPPPTR